MPDDRRAVQRHHLYLRCDETHAHCHRPQGRCDHLSCTDRGDVATEINAEGYTISYEYDSRGLTPKQVDALAT